MAVMCWGSIKMRFLFILALLVTVSAHAAIPNSVTVSASGKELSDAMVAAVRSAVMSNFKNYPGFSKQVLDEEIIPAAAQVVSSYRVVDGTDGSPTLNISAVVELSLVRNLFDFSPKALGLEDESGKAIIVFRGATISFLERMKTTDYYDSLKKMLAERLERRHFKVSEATEDIKEATTMGDSVSEPAVLRIYGVQNEADIALGVHVEPDSSGRGGWQLKATLLLVKSGKTLGQYEHAIPSPRYNKETFQAEFHRALMDAANQAMLGVQSRAGGETSTARKEDFLRLKIVNLKNPVMLEKFRSAATAVPEIRSLMEFSVSRGSYELAVDSRLSIKQLEQKLKTLTWDDMEAEITRGEGLELTVNLKSKAVKSEAEMLKENVDAKDN